MHYSVIESWHLRITLYPSKSKTDYLTFTRNYSHKTYTCACVCLSTLHICMDVGQCTRMSNSKAAILVRNICLGDIFTESLSYTAILVAHIPKHRRGTDTLSWTIHPNYFSSPLSLDYEMSLLCWWGSSYCLGWTGGSSSTACRGLFQLWVVWVEVKPVVYI
jgi:hypothetical protein